MCGRSAGVYVMLYADKIVHDHTIDRNECVERRESKDDATLEMQTRKSRQPAHPVRPARQPQCNICTFAVTQK